MTSRWGDCLKQNDFPSGIGECLTQNDFPFGVCLKQNESRSGSV